MYSNLLQFLCIYFVKIFIYESVLWFSINSLFCVDIYINICCLFTKVILLHMQELFMFQNESFCAEKAWTIDEFWAIWHNATYMVSICFIPWPTRTPLLQKTIHTQNDFLLSFKIHMIRKKWFKNTTIFCLESNFAYPCKAIDIENCYTK